MSSVSLAFIDETGKITLVLNTDVSLATSFISSKHIIDITSLEVQPNINWTYDGINFAEPPAPPAPPLNPIFPTDNVTPPIIDNPNPIS